MLFVFSNGRQVYEYKLSGDITSLQLQDETRDKQNNVEMTQTA